MAGLAYDTETHVLQHRHHIGQRQLLVRVVHPEMHPRFVEAGRAVKIGGDRAGADRGVDLADIGQRVLGAVPLAIAGRKGILV